MIYFASVPSSTKHQSGVVLVISLIMLLALTLIGVTSSNVTGLEGKMAANSKNVNLAFQAAEAALRAAEVSLATTTTKPIFTCNATATSVATNQGVGTSLGAYTSLYGGSVNSNGILSTAPSSNPVFPGTDFYTSITWTDPTKYIVYSNVINGTNKLVGLSQAPAYIVEELSIAASSTNLSVGLKSGSQVVTYPGSINTFRITAHGWGGDQNSVATVQSIVRVRYPVASAC
ncbi:MAG: PilX N-terminal domain-containing pilus assembly protein [Methylococcales bacterium]